MGTGKISTVVPGSGSRNFCQSQRHEGRRVGENLRIFNSSSRIRSRNSFKSGPKIQIENFFQVTYEQSCSKIFSSPTILSLKFFQTRREVSRIFSGQTSIDFNQFTLSKKKKLSRWSKTS